MRSARELRLILNLNWDENKTWMILCLQKIKLCVILVKNNNMKIIRLQEAPRNYGITSVLTDEEIKKLTGDDGNGIEEIRYWYCYGDYEGNGQMLILKDKKWYYHSMGHCSCYGPLDEISFNVGYSTLPELMEKCSSELQKQLKPLVEI